MEYEQRELLINIAQSLFNDRLKARGSTCSHVDDELAKDLSTIKRMEDLLKKYGIKIEFKNTIKLPIEI